MTAINIEIDLEKLKDELQKEAIRKIVSNYFGADDVSDWGKRSAEQKNRIEKIINKVDWNLMPEEMQRGIIREFIDKYIMRNR